MSNDRFSHDLAVANRKVIHDVNVHGWHVVKVSVLDEHPGWAYSIGLFHTFRHPEFLIFGLGLDLMHRLINTLGNEVRVGRRFAADAEHDRLLEKYRCVLKPVDTAWYPHVVGFATQYYKGASFPVLQCIWPDKRHRYPWQSGFDSRLVSHQPLLFERDPVEARAEALFASIGYGPKDTEPLS